MSHITTKRDGGDRPGERRAAIMGLLKMIFNFKKTPFSLADLAPGQAAVIAELGLPPDAAEPLMDLGLVAGSQILAVRPAPGGDPVVYRVDGAEIALRRETTRHIAILPAATAGKAGE